MRASALAAFVAVASSALVVVPLTLGGSNVAQTAGASRLLVFLAPKTGSNRGQGRLELVDRQGRVIRVLSTARYGTWAKWSPDDAAIAWEDPTGIHVEAADGSNPRLLVRPPSKSCQGCQQLSFLWSPDSRSLIVGSAGPMANQLQRVPIDGSTPTVLLVSTDPRRWYIPAWWTPDGKALVYQATRTVGFTGTSTRVLTPSTGKTVTIWSSPTSQGANAPIISANLRYWSYIKQLDQYHQQLRIIDKTTGATHIVRGVNSTNLVGWSPDSSALAVIDAGWHLVTVAPSGIVLHTIGPAREFFWGRRGQLFVIRDPGSTVVSDSLGGHPERLLFHAPKNEWVVSLDGN